MKIKSLIYLSILVFPFSCKKSDCNVFKKAYYPDEYYLIAEQSEINETWIKIEGLSLITNQKENIMVHNNWIFGINEIEIGDTIKKEKGKLSISIHKQYTVIIYDCYFNG